MPQEPVIVYLKDGGQPTAMHTVDANEALGLGDYVPAPPGGERISSEERAAALMGMRQPTGQAHAELQTPEQREENRRKANEDAELLAGVPEGAHVVVMAPQREERRSSTSGRASSQSTPSPTPAPPTPPAPQPATGRQAEESHAPGGRARG